MLRRTASDAEETDVPHRVRYRAEVGGAARAGPAPRLNADFAEVDHRFRGCGSRISVKWSAHRSVATFVGQLPPIGVVASGRYPTRAVVSVSIEEVACGSCGRRVRRVWTPPRMQPFSESPPLSATTSGSPSAAIAPVERGPATRLARNELPARSAAAVTRKGRSGAKDPRSGLTAAGDRARGRRAPSTPGVCLFREKSSFLQMARCMRSGAVVCPASLLAASHPPRACMEIRGSSPNRPSVLEGTAANAGFPDPVSLTVCPYHRPTCSHSRRRRTAPVFSGGR